MEQDLPLLDLFCIAVLICVAIGGLVMASIGGSLYGLGIAIFIVAVIAGFWMIKRHYDRIEARRH